MNTAFDIKLEAKDLFRFNMYQTYTRLPWNIPKRNADARMAKRFP